MSLVNYRHLGSGRVEGRVGAAVGCVISGGAGATGGEFQNALICSLYIYIYIYNLILKTRLDPPRCPGLSARAPWGHGLMARAHGPTYQA